MPDLIFVWGVILMHQSLPYVFQPAAVQEEDEKKKIGGKKAESVPQGPYSHFSPQTPHHRALMQLAVQNEWVNYWY